MGNKGTPRQELEESHHRTVVSFPSAGPSAGHLESRFLAGQLIHPLPHATAASPVRFLGWPWTCSAVFSFLTVP
jgi:hypothetical protein